MLLCYICVSDLSNKGTAIIIHAIQMEASRQRLMQFQNGPLQDPRARGSMDEIRNRDEIPSRSWLNYSQGLSILAKQRRELACR